MSEFDIAKLSLQPGDTLVVKVTDTIIGAAATKRLQEFFRNETGHQRVLVIDKGFHLSVVRPANEENAG